MNEIKKYLKNILPRKYQEEIYNSCKEKNCLVILPTGVGKTLIALMLSIQRQIKYPGSKIVFLAPTRPLAQQHLTYFKKNLPEMFGEMELFTGKINAEKRKKLWQNSDIIFSTPQCVANDIKKRLYNFSDVSLLIEDECHRCLKNYSYTFVAKKYREQSLYPRILGLTASPGTDKKTITEITEHLDIEEIEVRTRKSEDVKPYLQDLEFEVRWVEFPLEFNEIKILLKMIYNRKIEELRSRKLLFVPPNKITLLNLQTDLMKQISAGNKNYNLFGGVQACTQAIKIDHATELLETQTIYSLNEYLHSILEQARLKKSKSVQMLVKQTEFNAAFISINNLISQGKEHPKINETKEIVKEQLSKNPKSKTIIFTQYRLTAQKVSKELNQIKGVKSKVFVGQTKKQTRQGEDTGLSQKEQKKVIEEFSGGEINCLISTSIGEEGLDIPEVNSVIFYEPVPSAIRKIQRAGRTARLMKGNLFILVTKDTRDQSYYYASIGKEKKMYRAIEELKNNLKNNNLEEKSKTETQKQKTLF